MKSEEEMPRGKRKHGLHNEGKTIPICLGISCKCFFVVGGGVLLVFYLFFFFFCGSKYFREINMH